MRTTRWLGLVAAAVAACLVLTACGGASSGSAASSGEVDTSATVRVAAYAVPTSFDPVLIRVPFVSDPQFISPVYDQLLVLDKDLKVAPGLASEWEVSDDGKVLTLTLRTEAKFQDGSGFDSAVVKANIERAKTLPGSTAAPALADVAQVVTDGPDKVRIEFTVPSFSFPYALASNFGISSMVSGEAIASGADLSRTPAGSGPFTLTNYGQDRVTFTRNDQYWDRDNLPAVREATIISIPDDNARLGALQSGQIDLAATVPHQEAAYASLVESGQAQLVTSSGMTMTMLVNNTLPQLNDVRVRKALSLAIDRESISEDLYGGGLPPAYQFQIEGMPGYVPEIDEDEHYDPKQAKKLLAEAGAGNLEMTMVRNGVEPWDGVATAVQDQLAKVGVKVTFKQYAPIEAGPAWRKGEGGSYMVSVLLGGDPVLYLDQYLFGAYTLGEVDPAIRSAYDKAMGLSLEDPARADALAELTVVMDEAPLHLPVLRSPIQYLAAPEVGGLDNLTFSQMSGMPEIRVLTVSK